MRSVTSDQAQKLLADGAPLVVTGAALPLAPAEVSPTAHYSAMGRTLVALNASPTRHLAQSGATALGELRPWLHDFGGELQLQAGRIGVDRATGETVALLIWQATAPPSQDWAVSVRLLQGGQEIARREWRCHSLGSSGCCQGRRGLSGGRCLYTGSQHARQRQCVAARQGDQ